MEHSSASISQSIVTAKKLIIKITVSQYPVHLTYLSLSSPLFAKRDYSELYLLLVCKSKIPSIPLRFPAKLREEPLLWPRHLQIKLRMEAMWWLVASQATYKTYSTSGRTCTWRSLKTRQFLSRLTIRHSIPHFSKTLKLLPERFFLILLSVKIQDLHCLNLFEKISIRKGSGTGQKRS